MMIKVAHLGTASGCTCGVSIALKTYRVLVESRSHYKHKCRITLGVVHEQCFGCNVLGAVFWTQCFVFLDLYVGWWTDEYNQYYNQYCCSIGFPFLAGTAARRASKTTGTASVAAGTRGASDAVGGTEGHCAAQGRGAGASGGGAAGKGGAGGSSGTACPSGATSAGQAGPNIGVAAAGAAPIATVQNKAARQCPPGTGLVGESVRVGGTASAAGRGQVAVRRRANVAGAQVSKKRTGQRSRQN